MRCYEDTLTIAPFRTFYFKAVRLSVLLDQFLFIGKPMNNLIAESLFSEKCVQLQSIVVW